MPCDMTPDEVYQCALCECQFEPGVAGTDRKGNPRCPQCGACESRLVEEDEVGDFVVARWTAFT